ncbi:MAG: hypothetical protein ACOCSE_03975 [Chitinivibrionales bacterium]
MGFRKLLILFIVFASSVSGGDKGNIGVGAHRSAPDMDPEYDTASKPSEETCESLEKRVNDRMTLMQNLYKKAEKAHESIIDRAGSDISDIEDSFRHIRYTVDGYAFQMQQIEPECTSWKVYQLENLRRQMDEDIPWIRKTVFDMERITRKQDVTRRTIESSDRAVSRALRMMQEDQGFENTEEFRRALDLIERSKSELAKGNAEGAVEMAEEARDISAEIVKTSIDSSKMKEIKERYRSLHERIQERILELRENTVNDPAVENLIREAEELVSKAEGYSEDNPIKALNSLKEAEKSASKVSSLDSGADRNQGYIERVRSKLERASAAVQERGGEKSRFILKKAQKRFENGLEKTDQGEVKQGRTDLDIAMKLAVKAVSYAEKQEDRSGLRLKNEIRKAEILVRRAFKRASGEQKRELKEAQRLLKKAGAAEDDPVKARSLINRATETALRIISAD